MGIVHVRVIQEDQWTVCDRANCRRCLWECHQWCRYRGWEIGVGHGDKQTCSLLGHLHGNCDHERARANMACQGTATCKWKKMRLRFNDNARPHARTFPSRQQKRSWQIDFNCSNIIGLMGHNQESIQTMSCTPLWLFLLSVHQKRCSTCQMLQKWLYLNG